MWNNIIYFYKFGKDYRAISKIEPQREPQFTKREKSETMLSMQSWKEKTTA